MKIKIDPGESIDNREVVFTGTSLKAYIIRRDEKPVDIHSAVYILMDSRRTGFYIGESGDTACGGFVNRFQNHKSRKTEHWWSLALCFTDTSELFDKVPVRKWIESRLNEIAKDAGYLVVSTAGASGAPVSDAENKLGEILDFCWLLGIPWGREKVDKIVDSGVQSAPKLAKSPSLNSKVKAHGEMLVRRKLNVSSVVASKRPIFLCVRNSADAKGFPAGDGFMVLKGSRVSGNVGEKFKERNSGYFRLRTELETNGTIKDGVFTDDYVFDSASAASTVVVGNSSSGNRDWRTKDGKPLLEFLK